MDDNTNDTNGAPDAGGATPSPPAATDTTDLQKQRDQYYEQLLRKSAEFDNYRKRVERERQLLGDAGGGPRTGGTFALGRRPGAPAQGGLRHRRHRGVSPRRRADSPPAPRRAAQARRPAGR